MKLRLVKRIEQLEAENANKFQYVARLSRYSMDVRQIPSKRAKIRSDYNLKEPDLETCREFGQRNIKAVKAMRSAKAAGKNILKFVDIGGEFFDDESCCCEIDPTMTHDYWVKLMDDNSWGKNRFK